MKSKKIFLNLLCLSLLILTIIATGCGRRRSKPAPEGRTEVVEQSHSERPQWTTVLFTETSDEYYYSGQASGRDYGLTVRLAKAEALKNMVENIEVMVRTEFTSVVKEYSKDSEVGRFIEDGISMVSENVRVRGLNYKEVYFEKLEKQLDGSVEYQYDVWSLIAIDIEDYYKARREVIDRMHREAQEKNADDLIETAETLKSNLLNN
ncbi:MAG: hypothetical protein ACQESP_09805 [Candidatus Muiribacteriota bacterium]